MGQVVEEKAAGQELELVPRERQAAQTMRRPQGLQHAGWSWANMAECIGGFGGTEESQGTARTPCGVRPRRTRGHSWWDSKQASANAPVLVFVHGARERGWIYGALADRLAAVFSHVYSIDLRGHSAADIQDPLLTGRLDSRKALLADVAALVARARDNHPQAKIVLGGQSIGATIALSYVAEMNTRPMSARTAGSRADALFLTAPALGFNIQGALEGLKRSGGLSQLARFRSSFPAGGLQDFTSGSAWYNRFRRDYALGSLTLNYVKVLVSLVAFWKIRYPRHILEPVLVVAGTNDKLIDHRTALDLHSRLMRNSVEAQVVTVEGAYHTVLFDETSDKTDQVVAEWVSGIGESDIPPMQSDYCVYRRDIWIRAINRLRLSPPVVFAFYLGLFLGLKVLITTISGTLASPTLLADYRVDAATMSVERLYHTFSSMTPPSVAHWFSSMARSSYYATKTFQLSGAEPMPLMRDYIDILVMGLFALRMTLLHGHWERLSVLPSRLWANNVVNKDAYTDADKQAVLQRYDLQANSPLKKVIAACTAVGVASVMYWLVAVKEAGIYPTLLPSGSTMSVLEWQSAVFAGWWANPVHHPWSFAVHAGITLFVLYYTFRSNQVGASLVGMLYEVVGHPHGFAPQPDHVDGLAGLRPVRELLIVVFLTLAVLLLVMALLLFFLPYRLGWTILFPALLIALTVSPVIIMRTINGFQGILFDHRNRRLAEVAARAEDVRIRITSLERSDRAEHATECNELSVQLEHLTYESSRLESMPTELFSRQGAVVALGTYILPMAALIAQFASQ